MRASLRRWLLLGALAGASLGLAAAAAGDDRANAESVLASLAHDDAHKALIADPVRRAQGALERATRLRTAGDPTHARLAEGLALQWAQTARDLVRAADAEKQAADRRVDALDAGARVERERALLEEGIARSGRLRAELEAVEHASKEAPTRTAAVGASRDAGAGAAGDAGASIKRKAVTTTDGGEE